MSSFNTLRGATIRNAMTCRLDSNEGYAVVWDEDYDFKSYTEFDGLTTRLVSNNSYFSVATSGTAYVGPVSDQTPFDAGTYSTVKATFRIETGPNQTVPTMGRIQFQTSNDAVYDVDKSVDFSINPDNAYNEYSIDMSLKKEWQGNVTRIRIYPIIDGSAGNLIYLRSIRVQSPSSFACASAFSGSLCDKFSQYSHPCPWTGAGGNCEGSPTDDGISIVEGVNDRIIVNINGYGNQAVVITPTTSGKLSDIARDIEDKLSNIGIGGYAGSKVEAVLGKLVITADDTRELTSSVVVGDTPAARTLGFFDSNGVSTAVCSYGVEAASRYSPAGTRQLSKSEIAHFYTPDPAAARTSIALDPLRYAVQAGRKDFAEVQQEQKVDFVGKTIIDFNNPITNNGTLASFSYTGDATSSTKFVILRPAADGSLTQYYSAPLPTYVGALVDRVFEFSVDVKVRKGDLVGIFDGKLDAGRIEQRPNASYYLYSGELSNGTSISSPSIEGRGEEGLRFFAHGTAREIEAVVDIAFDAPQPLEELEVFAIEETRVEEINLSRTQGGGLNGGPFISSSTGLDKFGSQAPPMTDLEALTDGVRRVTPDALTTHPSWLDAAIEPPDKYEQTEFSLTLDFAKGVPVFFDIDKVTLYFRDVSNIKFFRVDYPLTTDETDTNINWGPVASAYSSVSLDGKLLAPATHPLYSNPIVPTVGSYEDAYQLTEYKRLDLSFPPVRARSIKYNVRNYDFVSDETLTTYSNYALSPSAHIMEMEVFARSTPVANVSDNFFFESSTDGLNYIVHPTVRDGGPASARYLIGYPVQYLRAHIRPQGSLEIRGITTTLSVSSDTKVKTSGGGFSTSLGLSHKDYTNSKVVDVTNDTEESANYFVSIAAQRSPVERCILWNKFSSEEETQESEIGPSPIVSKRVDYYPRPANIAQGAPGYVVDPVWLLNRNAQCHISYDHAATWEPRGNILCNYNDLDYLSSENQLHAEYLFTYILIDLGDSYDIDTIQEVLPSAGGFSAFGDAAYANNPTADPASLDIINDFVGTKEDARWIRYRAFSKETGAPDIAALAYIRVSLDVLSLRNSGKIPWVSATKLTNFIVGSTSGGNECGEGWQCSTTGFTNYYALNLEDAYNITNIVTGPSVSDALASEDDIDLISPGGPSSAYSTSSRLNTNIAYSGAETSDPQKVVWGAFNGDPGEKSQWVLVRSIGSIKDELIVHIEDNINENKPAFASTRWWTALLGEVQRDEVTFQEDNHSIRIDYGALVSPQEEEIELRQSWGIDHSLAKKDQLRLLIHVSDVSQIDFSKGHIAIGRNTTEDNSGLSPLADVEPDYTNYFQWNLSDMESLLTSGWNELFLPFTDNYRVGQPRITQNDFLSMAADSLSGKSRIRWFRLRFAGKDNNAAFSINLGGVKIVRGDYVPAKFGNGLYLAGNDYARFPLTNFDTLRGTMEFYLNPDWTKSPGCNSCDDPIDHTIFRFFNSDGYVLAAYMTGEGLRVYFTDGTQHYFQTDNNSPEKIVLGENTHLAVTWDLLGSHSEDAIRIYVNNKLSSSFPASSVDSAGFRPNPNTALILGGIAWDGVVSSSAQSVGGAVDNMRVYNYPRSDFSHSLINEGLEHIRPSDDLVEISVDGITFYDTSSRGHELPLLVRNVAPGQAFQVYIRNKELEGALITKGQSRTSFVEILRALPG